MGLNDPSQDITGLSSMVDVGQSNPYSTKDLSKSSRLIVIEKKSCYLQSHPVTSKPNLLIHLTTHCPFPETLDIIFKVQI